MEEVVFAKRRNAVFVLIFPSLFVFTGGFMVLALWAFVKSYPVLPPSPLVFAALMVIDVPFFLLSFWALIGVLGSGNYLETCPEGISIGGFLCCHCAWDNIKEISALTKPYASLSGKRIPSFVAIDIHSTQGLHFITPFHRFMSGLAIRKNRILILPKMSGLTVEVMLSALLDRWQLAMTQTRESRA